MPGGAVGACIVPAVSQVLRRLHLYTGDRCNTTSAGLVTADPVEEEVPSFVFLAFKDKKKIKKCFKIATAGSRTRWLKAIKIFFGS